jgi:hypothetical protein
MKCSRYDLLRRCRNSKGGKRRRRLSEILVDSFVFQSGTRSWLGLPDRIKSLPNDDKVTNAYQCSCEMSVLVDLVPEK